MEGEDREISLGNWAESNSDASKPEGEESGWLNESGATAEFNVQSVLEKSVSSFAVNQVESEESNVAADAVDKSISIALNMSRNNMMKEACRTEKLALKTKC